MSHRPESRIIFQSDAGSALGQVNLAGFIQNHTGTGPGLRVLGSYALVYVLRGPGQHRDRRGTKFDLVTGDLLLVFPEIPHRYGPPDGQTWDEFYIVFSGPVFDLWRRKGLLNPSNPVRHLEPVDYWLRRFEEVTEAGTDSLQRVGALQHVLADALAEPATDEPAFFPKAKRLLEAESLESVEDVARQVKMSYENFRKQFTRLAGMPPAQYRATRLMVKACALLHAEDVPLKVIAERLGYCDEFHFSRRFKQVMGVSPSQFRNFLPATGTHR